MRREHFLVVVAVVASLGASALDSGKLDAAGEVTVSPTTLSFPATYVGDSSSIPVTVTNVSSSPVTPNYSGGAPNDADNFGGSQNCAGVTLPAGGTCTFTYEFTPSSAGSHSSSTTIGVENENFAISMSGTGLFPISISPTTLAFPDTPVGSTSSIDVVVRNDSPVSQTPNYSGGAPIDPTNFGGSQNCAGVTLPAGGTCTFTYTFTPTSSGPLSSSTTIGVDNENFAISMSGNGNDSTTTTSTSTTTTTNATTTSTNPASASAAAAAATTAPSGGGATSTVPAGTIVVGPGPLSAGGDARVIAQGIMQFADGSVGWDDQVLDLAPGPFEFEQSPPTFLVATGAQPLLVRTGDGQSRALLDQNEAAFVTAESPGDLSTLAPDGTGQALRISLASSIEPFSFTPGPGRRDVNLVAATLQPGERLHVISPFPVLVAVTDGALLDAPENTEIAAGTAQAFNDADLFNGGDVPAVVLIAAVGSFVP